MTEEFIKVIEYTRRSRKDTHRINTIRVFVPRRILES